MKSNLITHTGSMIPAEIQTIKAPSETRLKEKGSVFITSVLPVTTLNEVETFLAQIRKKYFDATHHCYAYRLSGGTFKSSDNGEPSGSAGLRILNAIDHFHLTNLLIIVTRYFGGTKLGIGPLGKAYYTAVEQNLLTADIITLKAYVKLEVTVEFEHINHIHRILADTGSKILCTEYSEYAKLDCLIKTGVLDSVKGQITEITRGKGKFSITHDYYLI